MQQRHSSMKHLLEAAKVVEATIDVTNEPSMSELLDVINQLHSERDRSCHRRKCLCQRYQTSEVFRSWSGMVIITHTCASPDHW